jgi:hypothetical protein
MNCKLSSVKSKSRYHCVQYIGETGIPKDSRRWKNRTVTTAIRGSEVSLGKSSRRRRFVVTGLHCVYGMSEEARYMG